MVSRFGIRVRPKLPESIFLGCQTKPGAVWHSYARYRSEVGFTLKLGFRLRLGVRVSFLNKFSARAGGFRVLVWGLGGGLHGNQRLGEQGDGSKRRG